VSHDTWAHRLVGYGVRPLARTRITPNQVTAARLVTGLAAAAAFAGGDAAWSHAGGGLWIVSMLLDRADGLLARLTGTSSAWGHVFDLSADFAVTTLLFVGMGLGLRGGSLGTLAAALGVVAGLAIALIFWLVYRIDSLLPGRAAAVPTAGGFDADDTLFLVGPVAWLGWLQPFLVAAAIGAPIAAVVAALAYMRVRRRVAQRSKTPVGIE
jgi:phosphatidylglycerophosphate synthase